MVIEGVIMIDNIDFGEVGNYLKALRESKGLTMAEAKKVYISWERYETDFYEPNLYTISDISKIENDEVLQQKIIDDLTKLSCVTKRESDQQENSILKKDKPIWLKKGSDWKH